MNIVHCSSTHVIRTRRKVRNRKEKLNHIILQGNFDNLDNSTWTYLFNDIT